MAWWAIIETATNRLHSVGSVLADPLPPEFTAVLLPSQLDQDRTVWDVATRAFISRPPVVAPLTDVELLMTQPEIQQMNPANQDRVRTAITRVAPLF